MSQKEYIEAIGEAWDYEGFLGCLREGVFDKSLYDKLYNSILSIKIDDEEDIDRELIQLLWFIPIFMYRFKHLFNQVPSAEYDDLREKLEDALALIFHYP